MRVIPKLPITDARLTSSTVPELVAATYAGGTTYAAGDRVGLAPVYGEAQIVYESLQAANIGHALPVPLLPLRHGGKKLGRSIHYMTPRNLARLVVL